MSKTRQTPEQKAALDMGRRHIEVLRCNLHNITRSLRVFHRVTGDLRFVQLDIRHARFTATEAKHRTDPDLLAAGLDSIVENLTEALALTAQVLANPKLTDKQVSNLSFIRYRLRKVIRETAFTSGMVAVTAHRSEIIDMYADEPEIRVLTDRAAA